ncbi:MAG: RluA family pseudouridine synthase [Fimbriimonadaceae bacterium]|nr:RluA family pseudouridine synthase [Fimbriimonadaceae bacterium]
MPDLPEPLDQLCEASGSRLDLYLARQVPGLTRSQAQRLIDSGAVTLDGLPGKSGQAVRAGQRLQVVWPPPLPSPLTPEPLALDVIHEDADLLVLNKPAGLVVHPARGHWTGTLVNALLAHCDDLSGIGGELRPGIVHRIDKDTSGLLVVAKHDLAHSRLSAQFKDHSAQREYLALAVGQPAWDQQTVEAPLGRPAQRRDRMAVVPAGREARTHLTVLERFAHGVLLQARLETGRTHQVRVHCTWIGHPLFGDPLYGVRRREALGPLPEGLAAVVAALPGQALHAATLRFTHPTSGAPLVFSVPPPGAFVDLLAALRRAAGEPLAGLGE